MVASRGGLSSLQNLKYESLDSYVVYHGVIIGFYGFLTEGPYILSIYSASFPKHQLVRYRRLLLRCRKIPAHPPRGSLFNISGL